MDKEHHPDILCGFQGERHSVPLAGRKLPKHRRGVNSYDDHGSFRAKDRLNLRPGNPAFPYRLQQQRCQGLRIRGSGFSRYADPDTRCQRAKAACGNCPRGGRQQAAFRIGTRGDGQDRTQRGGNRHSLSGYKVTSEVGRRTGAPRHRLPVRLRIRQDILRELHRQKRHRQHLD